MFKSGSTLNVPSPKGESIYTFIEDAHIGAASLWGIAKDQQGHQYFVKKYNNPTSLCTWFDDYAKYLEEVNRRLGKLEKGRVPKGLVTFVDSKHWLWQVCRYFQNVVPLDVLLSQGIDWEIRKEIAFQFLEVLRSCHHEGIAHLDLKPSNLLIEFVNRKRVRTYLIDFDRPVLRNMDIPWIKEENFLGTHNYFSPEHSQKDTIPDDRSDVFTCGLILYEILARGGYPKSNGNEFHINNFTANPPQFWGPFLSDASELSIKIHNMLSLKPEFRTSIEDVYTEMALVMNKKLFRFHSPSFPGEWGHKKEIPALEFRNYSFSSLYYENSSDRWDVFLYKMLRKIENSDRIRKCCPGYEKSIKCILMYILQYVLLGIKTTFRITVYILKKLKLFTLTVLIPCSIKIGIFIKKASIEIMRNTAIFCRKFLCSAYNMAVIIKSKLKK